LRYFGVILLIFALVPGAEWQPEERLTENNYSDFSYWSTQRRVVVDQQGRVHVAWYVMNSALGTYRFQIYYKRYNSGSGWSADTMISADLSSQNLNSKYVSLALDSAGRVYAVGTDYRDGNAEIYYASASPSQFVTELPVITRRETGAVTVVRGKLYRKTGALAGVLIDIDGRRVKNVFAGLNDVSDLSPGVYFIKEPGGADRLTDRVIVVR